MSAPPTARRGRGTTDDDDRPTARTALLRGDRTGRAPRRRPGLPGAGAATVEHAKTLDGFHGIEICGQPGFSLAVSYWDSLDAIDTWRNHPQHRHAKAQGMSRWFTGYATRIAQVIDAY